MRDIGTVDTGSPRAVRPEGFLCQQCQYLVCGTRKAMLQLFCSIVDCTVKQSRSKLACCELHHRLSMFA